ncbi:hypothetical protein K432DRAFT_465183 [Lepidopterella palustris CBS 459.81]|uniref:Uncharacterized protein n=1 Tax=Lepidopterella palustris CBS 459.81 TaxID=1314670 RepID=A0A8E2E1T7_9PEZI|nr:hypothetical protein K432DRAFT_465183 [Lepidopterella palustris CBS 459.81]
MPLRSCGVWAKPSVILCHLENVLGRSGSADAASVVAVYNSNCDTVTGGAAASTSQAGSTFDPYNTDFITATAENFPTLVSATATHSKATVTPTSDTQSQPTSASSPSDLSNNSRQRLSVGYRATIASTISSSVLAIITIVVMLYTEWHDNVDDQEDQIPRYVPGVRVRPRQQDGYSMSQASRQSARV